MNRKVNVECTWIVCKKRSHHLVTPAPCWYLSFMFFPTDCITLIFQILYLVSMLKAPVYIFGLIEALDNKQFFVCDNKRLESKGAVKMSILNTCSIKF